MFRSLSSGFVIMVVALVVVRGVLPVRVISSLHTDDWYVSVATSSCRICIDYWIKVIRNVVLEYDRQVMPAV